MSSNVPRVSVIIPSYESHETIEGCFRTLHTQTFPDFETIVIDSSSTGRVEEIVRSRFPQVRFERSPQRLLPHAARNRGAQLARSDILVFTDPDIYPEPEWLERLLAAHFDTGHVIIGAIACFGRDWLDVGAHFCKFDKWLPGGEPGPTDIGPTGNMLCRRDLFERLGGFPGETWLGDTVFSWRLTEHGYRLWFVPTAVVHHHHLTAWRGLLGERFDRGNVFAQIRMTADNWTSLRVFLHIVVTVLPLRLIKLTGRVLVNAWRAGLMRAYLRTIPIIIAGQAAWLAGEMRAYLNRLFDARLEY